MLVKGEPVDDVPQLEAIVSVEVVWDGVQSSCREVLSWNEGAVVEIGNVPSHQLHDSVISK